MQRKYRIVIEGTAPLIQSNPALAIESMVKNTKRKKTPSVVPSEDWRPKVYLSRDGTRLLHPSTAFELLLQEAATAFKAKGRGSMRTAVRQTCFVQGDWMTITNKKEPDSVREVHPRNQAGQLVPAYLPEFAIGWQMELYLLLTDDEVLTPAHLKEMIDFGGYRIGIGVSRPKYGRFIVTTWELVDDEKAEAA